QPVEEHLVRVLERAQIDVPLEVFVLAPIRLVGAHDLLVERLDVRRKKPEQSEITPFLLGERRPFVQDRQGEDRRARRAGGFVHGRSLLFDITVSVASKEGDLPLAPTMSLARSTLSRWPHPDRDAEIGRGALPRSERPCRLRRPPGRPSSSIPNAHPPP